MTAGKSLKTACNLCYVNCGIEVLVKMTGASRKCAATGRTRNRRAISATRRHGFPFMRMTGIALPRRCVVAPTAASTRSTGTWRLRRLRKIARHRRSPWWQEHRVVRRRRAGQPCRRRLCQRHCCARSVRAASSMRFRRRRPATSGSMAICSAARRATPPRTSIIAICLLVIGANPWIAHGFPNARDHLNQIRKDPARKLIVIDPRRTETAEMADLHLAVRPGADCVSPWRAAGHACPVRPGRSRLHSRSTRSASRK